MSSKTTIFIADDVEEMIARVAPYTAESKRGRAKTGLLTTSGFIRFALLSWDEMVWTADHGLNTREVRFVASVVGKYILENGGMPFNPALHALVGASKSALIGQGVDSRELALRLEALTVAQQCKLFLEIVQARA